MNKLQRGDIFTNNVSEYKKGELLKVNYTFSQHFRKPIKFGSQINVTLGMVTTTARFFPFYIEKHTRVMIEEATFQKIYQWTKENVEFGAYIWFQNPHYLVDDEILVLSQLDLPPSTLRFFGSAIVESILPTHPNPELYHIKIKTGKIKNSTYSETSILVENLAKTKEGAQTLMGKVLEPPFGKITSLF